MKRVKETPDVKKRQQEVDSTSKKKIRDTPEGKKKKSRSK